MATFTINLNGGDVETPDNELYFKLYGSANGYTVPFKTTGSDLSDPNVSTLNGIATIINVNVGTETSFKVGVIDTDGNESELSDAYVFVSSTVEYPLGNVGQWATSLGTTVMRGAQFTMTESGVINSIWIWVDTGNANDAVAGLYSDNAGVPGSLLATSNTLTDTISGWNEFQLTVPYRAAANEIIWISFSPINFQTRYNTAQGLRAVSGQTGYQNPLPATFVTPTPSVGDISVYALYLPDDPVVETELFTVASAVSPDNEDNTTSGVAVQSTCTVTVETTDVYWGTYSIRVASTNGNTYSRARINFDVETGVVYRVTMAAKKLHAGLAALGQNGASAAGFEGNTTVYITDQWDEYTFYLKGNATGNYYIMLFALWNVAGVAGDAILIDKVYITKLT